MINQKLMMISGGDSFDGQIGSVIDTFVLDTTFLMDAHSIHIAGTVYAFLYRHNSAELTLKTVNVADDGTFGAIIDTWEIDSGVGKNGGISRVYENVFVIWKSDGWSDGQIITISIADNGTITKALIDSEDLSGHTLGDNVFALDITSPLNYVSVGDNSVTGRIHWFSVSQAGVITYNSSEHGGWEYFAYSACSSSTLKYVSGITVGTGYVVAYISGTWPNNFIKVKTLKIAPGFAVLDTLDLPMNADAYGRTRLFTVPGFAGVGLAYYLNPTSNLVSISISSSGIMAVEDTLASFGGAKCSYPSFVNVKDNGFMSVFSTGDVGFQTFKIESDGSIVAIDQLLLAHAPPYYNGKNSEIIHVSGDVYVTPYRSHDAGFNEKGYALTINVT